jgi:ankyrin repeat protein
LLKEGGISLDLLNGMVEGTQRERPIHLAATCGSAEVIELLALAGADVNQVNLQGATAIGIVAASGNLDSVEVLSLSFISTPIARVLTV